MSDSRQIDWGSLANDLSAIRHDPDGGRTESGGRALALVAIERLIGPDRLAAAVDHYVAGLPGFELARSMLWVIHPWSAMLRCREIFACAEDINERRAAVELLRVVADERALPWVGEFLADPDLEIQAWGIGVVDQLLFSALVDAESCEPLLALARSHENPQVREAAAAIDEQIRSANS